MKKHFTYITAMLLVLVAGLNGCKKDAQVTPTPLTAGIFGKINPPGAAKSIVAISAAGTGNTSAKLDSSNGFNITGLAPGNYKVGFAAMPGFIAPDTVVVTVAADKNVDIGTVVFKASATSGSISGKINPPGAAKSIVAISAAGTGSTSAKLDSSNGFSITGLEAGNYKVGFAAMPGFIAPDTVVVTVAAGENVDIGTVVFKASATSGSISGKISPATAGTNIYVKNTAGLVRYYGASDAAGNFKINDISPGSYELSFAPSVEFATPANVMATVTAGNNTDVGTIVLNPAAPKAIDTIAGLLTFYKAADASDFISRAAADSAIVLLASFYVYQQALTPELLAAMNKIIVAKSIFEVNGASGTLTLNGLKEVAQLSIIGGINLTTLNLPALSRANMELRDCPSLTIVNISALNLLGSLTLYNTGFTSLAAFQSAGFKPLILEIKNNKKLSSLAGLNFVADSVYDCTISGNTVLANLNGLQAIKRFRHETVISNNPVLQSLTGLENAVYARRLTLSNNPQLNSTCPAKVLLNYLANAPTFTEWQTNPITGQTTLVTLQPLVASANGSYATRADLVSAVGQCP